MPIDGNLLLNNRWFRMGAVLVGLFVVLLLVVFGVRWWRGSAGEQFDERKHVRMEKFREIEKERNELIGENTGLRRANEEGRARIAELETKEEAQTALIDQAGGRIEQQQDKLEQIEERLKSDQAVINAPADRCVRCRRFSAVALEQRLISQPLACSDECR